LFNKFFSPVILEGKLFNISSGKFFGKKMVFGLKDKKALKPYPEDEKDRKEIILRVTAERTVDKLIANLEKKAAKSLS